MSLRTVVLRHELPDGSWHFDWLLEMRPGGEDDRRLMAFRTMARADEWPPPGEVRAERLQDHRGLYLDYQGPISGGRGSVWRVAAGELRWLERGEGAIVVEVVFEAGRPRQWRGEAVDQDSDRRRRGGEASGGGDFWFFRLLDVD